MMLYIMGMIMILFLKNFLIKELIKKNVFHIYLRDVVYNIINENLERYDLEINVDDYIEIFKCCYYTSNNEKINYLN